MDFSFQYHAEPGLVTDAIKILLMKLNPQNLWLPAFTYPDTYSQDVIYLNEQLQKYPDPYSKLYLFVFSSKTKSVTFLTTLLLKHLQADFINFSISSFLAYFDNIDVVKNEVLSFYLGEQDYTNLDIESIIRHSEFLPDKLKYLLLGFYYEPAKFLNHLKKQLFVYYSILTSENQNHEFPLTSSTFASLITSCIPNPNAVLSRLTDPIIRYSTCSSIPHALQFNYTSSLWMIFAPKSVHAILAKPVAHSFETLMHIGDALRDKNRIAIINLLQARDSMQIEELKAALNLSSTSIRYHLNLMHKASLIIEYRENKKSSYALNPSGLKFAADALLNLANGLSI